MIFYSSLYVLYNRRNDLKKCASYAVDAFMYL